MLFDFQKFCIKKALECGKFALFEDCGLGKTFQQLEWAYHVAEKIEKPVLILAPLGVVPQTIQEGIKFGYKIEELGLTAFDQDLGKGIYITNYDNIDNIDCGLFGGVVLDVICSAVVYALKNRAESAARSYAVNGEHRVSGKIDGSRGGSSSILVEILKRA